MVRKLQILVGSDRFHVEIPHVNDPSRPTEIDTDKFVGRILIRVRDFTGITPDGGPPVQDEAYFSGRNRKFAIQIEGRFKARSGVKPYDADEIQFGSDFDRLIDFPRNLFNAGMKVAQWIDPATFYEEHPPNGRPYIMSPYAACMNTIAAWPAPDRVQDAVVVLRHTEAESDGAVKHHSEDVPAGQEGLVPAEMVDEHSKKNRHLIRYWRFLGFKTDPKIASWLAENAPHILTTPSPTNSLPAPPRLTHKASLGVIPRTESPGTIDSAPTSGGATPPHTNEKKRSFGLSGLKAALGGSGSNHSSGSSVAIKPEDVNTADRLRAAPEGSGIGISTRLDSQLGPWKFSSPGIDIIEDNTFVFVDHSVSTPKRRKFFCESNGKNRKTFFYDPDVVYATSFFTPMCDLNTFDLAIGPVRINLDQFFKDMPIRYTLRSTRYEQIDGVQEEEVFCTISFQLVDV